jgi:hypothetical protein
MLSRALSSATVMLLIGCLTAGVARAVENLDAGKSPSQIFSNTCSACHKSPRGLLKNTPASSLPGFLRQHYTTGTDMAAVLSSYLISNGAADPRYQSKDQPRKDARKDARQDPRQDEGPDQQPDRFGRRQRSAAPPAQEASRPDADAARPQGEGTRPGRDAKRYGRSRAAPDAAMPADGQPPVQAATDSKSGVRQKQGRRGRPVPAEPPKTEQVGPAAKEDNAPPDADKSETGTMDSVRSAPDTIKVDTSNTDATTIKVEAPKENAGTEANPLRLDPVPPTTPAPPASAATAPDPSAATTSATPAPVTATAPAATTAPAGPPVPPISR